MNKKSRRHFLQATAGAFALSGLAGCTMTAGSLDASMESLEGVEELVMFKGAPAHGEFPADTTHVEHEMPGGHMEMDAVTVRMTASTDGSNNYHFMPHVAWIEPGQTVFWEHFALEGVSERRTHSVSSFGSAGLYPRLIPEGAEPFDSGYRAGTHGISNEELIDERFNRGMTELIGQEGGFMREFQEEGVYLYYCQPHHEFKMAAAVVVGELWGEGGTESVAEPDGWAPAMTADISDFSERDPLHGHEVREQVAELREMIHSGGEMMGHGGGGH